MRYRVDNTFLDYDRIEIPEGTEVEEVVKMGRQGKKRTAGDFYNGLSNGKIVFVILSSGFPKGLTPLGENTDG